MASDGVGLNLLNHPNASSSTLSAATLKEINDANVPIYMTGILVPHAICTIVIIARIVSRIWVLRKWFIDDTFILLAWLFSSALCVVYGISATTPALLGAPSDAASLQKDANPYIMRTYLGLIYYQLCLCLTKLSILAFYLRIFASRPRERRLARATVAFVLLYSLPMMLMSFLQCHPVPGQFFGRPMVCFGFPDLLISSASLHSATDAWLIAMVVPCVAALDVPRRQRVALALVLGLGVFVVAASMVRLQLSLHLHYRPAAAGVTGTLAFFVMTVLECDIALICASAPALRTLLARLIPAAGAAHTGKRKSLEEVAAAGESFDLTSLTYHGYPWATHPSTPFARSRNPSVASHLNRLRTPAPPVPALTAPRRAPPVPPTAMGFGFGGRIIAGTAPRRPKRPPTPDAWPILDDAWDAKRTSSVYSQDTSYDVFAGHEFETTEGVILKTMTLSLHSEYVARDDDPPLGGAGRGAASPNRLSPISGLSGDTFAADRSSSGTKNEKSDKGNGWGPADEIPREEQQDGDDKPEVPLRSPLREGRR
ncbi:hypothetical protein EsH8_X_000411 [Colletotrichum jinshuiense]